MTPNRRLSQSGNLLLESTPDHLERYEGNSPPALWFVASSRRVVVLSREVVVGENLCKLSVPPLVGVQKLVAYVRIYRLIYPQFGKTWHQ